VGELGRGMWLSVGLTESWGKSWGEEKEKEKGGRGGGGRGARGQKISGRSGGQPMRAHAAGSNAGVADRHHRLRNRH
jgi:hypothetical protein